MFRVVFLGSDAIALPALDWLVTHAPDQVSVVGVFTQPDRASGRGQKVQANAIKLWAQARQLPVLQPEKVGLAEKEQLAALDPDLVLVMAYGHLLKQDFIDVSRRGTLNLHTSILPKYRGASPIQTATALGETETGVTLMRIVQKLDAGPIADVARVSIATTDTAAEVEANLSHACPALLARCLPAILAGTQLFTDQDETLVTFCRKLEKADGVLDFGAPATALASRINGLMPWPGCAVQIGDQLVKFGLADTVLTPTGSPGEVLGADAHGCLIGTGQGTLRVRRLQRPGGKMLPAGEFLRGWPIATGTKLPSAAMPPLVSSRPFPRAKV